MHDAYPVIWLDSARDWLIGDDILAGWVAERGDDLVGHVLVRAVDQYHDRTPVPIWETGTGRSARELAAVSRLYTSPKERGRGTAARLLRLAVDEAHLRGFQPVLDVFRQYEAAIRLYRREGWTEIGAFDWHLYDGSIHPSLAFAYQPSVSP